jgi:bifunctional UDP-N-acetylglucosamine pyrophosphorylase/glucosamine-1-phosphate N-acetyltransferase
MALTLSVVVLAAGAGKRMNSDLPKVLHRVAGMPMVAHVVAAVRALQPSTVVVVVGAGHEAVSRAVASSTTVVQDPPKGTGHAVMTALPALPPGSEVLVVLGDAPLLTADTTRRLLEARRTAQAAVAVLGFRAVDPAPYGRLVCDAAGEPLKIVEARDCTPEQLRIDLVNSGAMAFDGALLPGLLERLRPTNAQGEYYVTDLIEHARAAGKRCVVVEGPEAEFLGVNSRAELAAVEAAMQDRLRRRAMDGGVTMVDPSSVWLSADTVLGRDVRIEPNAVFGPGVRIGDRVEVKAFCHIEGAEIGDDAVVGPYARVRPGSRIGRAAHIGNFVEVKNATLGEGVKANHLAYLGDADIGARSNIGAGVICVNYDGFGKWRTLVGTDAFVGSNAALVAPVRVGDRSNVTAGSVITSDVADDAVAFGRARQDDKPGAAPAMRARLKARAADPAMKNRKA